MKFSVLLPTRNRLELLKYAIQTVREQNYDDWEVIVSDNYSEEDISGYVQSLNEPRIKYFRTDSFVPVTDNWNNALEKSSGDYIIMLGDDDCLMRGFFSTIERMLDTYKNPDFIYTSAFLYAYPGVMPGFPDGFLQPYGYADFLRGVRDPFWLNKKEALDLVRQSMNFRVRFGYNMQFAIVNRNFVDSLSQKGKFFQSPYPDYYAMNAMLLKAERVLVCPKPVVTIGISPKSFGYFYFNESEQSGVEFLKNLPDAHIVKRVQDIILPGTNMNTSWLLAMETLKFNFGSEYDICVRYKRYRLLQLLYVFGTYSLQSQADKVNLLKLWHMLTLWEKLFYGISLTMIHFLLKPFPRSKRRIAINLIMDAVGTYPKYNPHKINSQFKNILEVFNNIDPEQF